MDERRARIIDALLCHLEGMDANELKGMMPKKEVEIEVAASPMDKEKGPMEKLMADKSGDNAALMARNDGEEDEPEMDDEEFAEMMKLS